MASVKFRPQILLLLLCIVLIGTSELCARSATDPLLASCRLDVWGTKDGLPREPITSIAQTPDGYLWLATSAGLVRYDGAGFTVFNTANCPSLQSNLITILTVDRRGTLWVGTEWGGFGTFQNGVYHRLDPVTNQWSFTESMSMAPDGSMWIGCHAACSIYHVVDGKAIPMVPMSKDLPDASTLVWEPGKGFLWMVQGTGICTLGTHGDLIKESLAASGHLYDARCAARVGDDLWIGTNNSGVCRINAHGAQWFTTRDGLPSNSITFFYTGQSNRLWIGTSSGLCRPSKGRLTTFTRSDGLSSSLIRCIFADREGNMWVGAGTGLNRFGATKVTPRFLGAGADTNRINQIWPSSSGAVWCASDQGLWQVRADADSLSTRDTRFDDARIVGVAASPGDLWVWRANLDNTMDLVHCDGKRQTVLSLPPEELSVDRNTVVAVPQGRQLAYFTSGSICTTDGARVIDKTTVNTGGYVFCARQSPAGTVWAGCASGLLRIDGKVGRVVDIAPLPSTTHVLSIDIDQSGVLWLGTDHGLARYSDGHCKVYGKHEGLPDDNLYEVMRDLHGAIWCGMHSGIFSVRVADLDSVDAGLSRTVPCALYSADDGVSSAPIKFTYGKSPDGRLWFCGEHSLSTIIPGTVVRNPIAPPVTIEHATVDGNGLIPGAANHVPPSSGTFQATYAGLSFVAPEQVKFRYQLVGFDAAWIDANGHRTVSYTNLPPGSYVFKVVACNNDGVWNTTGATIRFDLEPHYYQTAWFRILIVLAGLLLVSAVVAMRTRAVALRAAELEAQVRERTQELVEANAHITDAQAQLAAQNSELLESHSMLAAQNEELHAMQSELEAQNNELQSTQAELEAQYDELQLLQTELQVQNEEMVKTQTYLAEANVQLAALATTDGLTGLKNHRAFQEQLALDWKRYARDQRPLSIILLDVDKFKQYNDTYGHPGGDAVLRRVAAILTSASREGDFVARYGGEEFVVIAGDADADAAYSAAERYRQAIESADWPERAVTASFGVSTATTTLESTEALIASADSALYKSKQLGRNRTTHAGDANVLFTAA